MYYTKFTKPSDMQYAVNRYVDETGVSPVSAQKVSHTQQVIVTVMCTGSLSEVAELKSQLREEGCYEISGDIAPIQEGLLMFQGQLIGTKHLLTESEQDPGNYEIVDT